MGNHFEYLTGDDSIEFFQKVAEDVACQVPQTHFQKLASHLDTDIHFIKTAGPTGEDLGATERAREYIAKVAASDTLLPSELNFVWDKVAGEALETDLNSWRASLHDELPEECWPAVDHDLQKGFLELTKVAQQEKEAFIGTLWRVGSRGVQGARNLGRAVGSGARAAGRAVANTARGAAEGFGHVTSGRAWQAAKRDVKAGMIRSKQKALAAGAKGPMARAPGRIGEDVRRAQSAERQALAQKTRAEIAKDPQLGSVLHARGQADAAKRRAARQAKAPEPKPPPPPQSKTTTQTQTAPPPAETKPANTNQAGRSPQTAANEAKGAATPATGAAEAGPSITDAWNSFNTKGWAGMTPAEKSALIRAGAMTVGGHRVLTNRDVLTGERTQ